MKTSLMVMVLLTGNVFAEGKKPDLRQGTKAVDEKYLEDMTSGTPERKTLSHEVHAGKDRHQQVDSKRSRQYQEEDPVTTPTYKSDNKE